MSEMQYAGGLTHSMVKQGWRKAIDAAGLDVPKGMAMVRYPMMEDKRWGVAIVLGGRSWRSQLPSLCRDTMPAVLSDAAEQAKQWVEQSD